MGWISRFWLKWCCSAKKLALTERGDGNHGDKPNKEYSPKHILHITAWNGLFVNCVVQKP